MAKLFQRAGGLGVVMLIAAAVPLGFTSKQVTAHGRDMPASIRNTSHLPGPDVPAGLGVNIHFTRPQRGEMRMLAATGLKWVRMDFRWSRTERTRGHYNFSGYDRLLAALRHYRMRALLILDYGNPLYNHGRPPTTPTSQRAFTRWVAAAMRHFAGQGIVWEMWNEPNGSYWQTNYYEGGRGKHWHTFRVDLADLASHWGGAKDGVIHWPITHLGFGVEKTNHSSGKVEFSSVSIKTQPSARKNTSKWRNLRLFTMRRRWVFSNGPEFPGAKGSFKVGTDDGTPVGILAYDFFSGGNYVEALGHVSLNRFDEMRYKVKAGGNHSFLLRMIDSSNQTFQVVLPGPGPSYAKLALAVGKTIRAVMPRELYIGPAAVGIDLGFLQKCFQAGTLKYWNAVSVHPYRRTVPETVISGYTRLRKLIATYAPPTRHIPIISSEWGYSTVWMKGNAARQGKYLAREFLTNLMCHIPISIWYDWRNDGNNPKPQEGHFGMVKYKYHPHRHWVYTPKPAFFACRTLTHLLSGFQFDRRLDMKNPNDFILVFTRGKQRRWVAWSVVKPKPARSVITLPVPSGSYRVVNYLDSKRTAVTAGAIGLRLQLSTGPQYVIPE